MALIEIVPVFLGAGSIYWVRPRDKPSWQVQSGSDADPNDIVAHAVRELKSTPLVVHSTSWRFQRENLVLTYIAVISNDQVFIDGFEAIGVTHRDIARGSATASPEGIEVEEVIEHALRHLSWLARDDSSIANALPKGWVEALEPFPAQPFSAYHLSEPGLATHPSVQYAKTADGVKIAFATLGAGKPLVIAPPGLPFSNIQMEWEIPRWRRWNERLAEKSMLVRYDSRGSGLSDREVSDFSLDAMLLDLEAVVDSAGLQRFALYGQIQSGPVATAYAAWHPERVSHLILYCSYGGPSDRRESRDVGEGVRQLIDVDWRLFTETLTHVWFGWSEGDEARRAAALVRNSLAPEVAKAAYETVAQFDVSDLLARVKAPTLVMYRPQVPYPDHEVAQRLASCIPDARLVALEGDSLCMYLGDTQAMTRAIDEFLAGPA